MRLLPLLVLGACTTTTSTWKGVATIGGGEMIVTTTVDGEARTVAFEGGALSVDELEAGTVIDCGGGPVALVAEPDGLHWNVVVPPDAAASWLNDVLGDDAWAPSGDACDDGIHMTLRASDIVLHAGDWTFEVAPTESISSVDRIAEGVYEGTVFLLPDGLSMQEEEAARDAAERFPVRLEFRFDPSTRASHLEPAERYTGPGLAFDFG